MKLKGERGGGEEAKTKEIEREAGMDRQRGREARMETNNNER